LGTELNQTFAARPSS